MDSLRRKYNSHKNGAKSRGIPFELSFSEWLRIWRESGHLHERGVRKGCYVMARYFDKGIYEVSNVRIIPVEDNHHLKKPVTAEVRAEAKARRLRHEAEVDRIISAMRT